MVSHGPHLGNAWRTMPKKVQPYGSGEDAEYAGLARSPREPATSIACDLAATMTIREVAARAVEAVRALSHLTADTGELTDPDEVRDVVSGLAQVGRDLPQLCEQLARFLVAHHEDGRLAHGAGRLAHGAGRDPDFVLAEVSEALNAAGRAADMMAAALTEAGARAADLSVPSR
jgi:hypothetical protein